MEKCKTKRPVLIVKGGYHIWWCETHKRPLPWCDKERALEKQKEDLFFKFKNALTPYCCHTSGMHNPTHFVENPKKLCNNQKAKSFDRACKFIGFDPIAIPNPNGCYWCKRRYENEE